jgi:hypothetical protein
VGKKLIMGGVGMYVIYEMEEREREREKRKGN